MGTKKGSKKQFWSDDETRSICLPTKGPSLSVAQVARRYAMNANDIPSSLAFSDKFYHAIAFTALVLPTTVLRPSWSLRMSIRAFLHGGAIELIQPYFGRNTEWLDMVANSLGIAIGVLVGQGVRYTMRTAWSR